MLPLAHLYSLAPLILGHRGASAYAPENTLAAFERALALGADGFELDVALSADGVPVVIHDDRVDRTTDGRGAVADLSLAELGRLDAGYPQRFGRQFSGERLPTLEAVFARFGLRPIINVELKVDRTPQQRLAEQVVALVRAYGLERRVIVSSFQLGNLRRVRQLAPELPLAALYNLPRFAGRLHRWLGQALTPAPAPEAHHPEFVSLTLEAVRWYHGQGLRVNTWTVDDPADLRRLAAVEADGLITNCPDVALEATRR